MKEREVYWIVIGALALSGLGFLVCGPVKRRLGSLRRWVAEELLLVCMAVSFGGICSAALKDQDAMAEVRIIQMTGAILLAVGTVLISLLAFLEGRKMRRLAKAFTESLKGTCQMEEKPPFLDKEMETLWSGAWACARGIERMQYQQTSWQRMYLRFIPKAAERLFAEQELKEVAAGDYISGTGIIGCISVQADPESGRDEYQSVKNQVSDVFLKIQEEGQSVFLPQSGDLGKMWGIFLDGAETAVHTGIRLLAGVEERGLACDAAMLFCSSGYTYGVTGNESRVFPYFSADDGDELLFYAEKLRELGVKLAVTEEMAAEFQDTRLGMSLREIGYVGISGKNRNLYEVLEAYPFSERYGMERQAGKFAKALKLYYKSDFYLARNTFAEILRECPGDAVAKWYLFACEDRLGSVKSTEAGYGLFEKI